MDRIVGDVLRDAAQADGDAPFLKCGGEWRSKGDLDRRSDVIAGGLAAIGVQKGDRVALLLPNSELFVAIVFGAAKCGAIQVPLNCFLKGAFLSYQLNDCGATVLVTDAAGLAAAAPLLADTTLRHVVLVDGTDVEVAPSVGVHRIDEWLEAGARPPEVELDRSDLVSLMYTSGTTGFPKGCMLTHGYYTAIPRTYCDAGVFIPGDRLYSAFPLFHISGTMSFLNPLITGGSTVIGQEFSASGFMKTAKDEGATVLWGVGPMAMAVLATPPTPEDIDCAFRLAMWVPMPPARQEEFERRFSTPVISEMYGQTECSPITLNSVHGARRRDCIGVAGSHVDVRVVDDADEEVPRGELGEIVVRPLEPFVMYSGYWGKAEATVETWRNFWHHTGDYGRHQPDGFLEFVDRKKDALRRRGENVSSVELEVAILQHPAIQAAAVCAVPSPLGEDDIKACIICHDGADVTPEAMFDFFRDTLPYFAIPRYVEVRDSFPTSAVGRVMKHLLREEGVTPATWDLEALSAAVPKAERR